MTGEKMGGIGAILEEEIERAESAGASGQTVVLVEGASDRRAVEALARRRNRDLRQEGVVVVPIAGATNITRFLEILGPRGHDVPIAGLCDVAEVTEFRVALQAAGLDVGPTPADLQQHGFFVCVNDLEEELVRALGPDVMLGLIESQGQIRRFRSFQNQPAHRDKTIEAQLWIWLGNHKIRYASLMVEALDLKRVPRPLDGVMSYVSV